jgi:CheY-like chemotaxis protein
MIVNSILLIDDDPFTNFLHYEVLKETKITKKISITNCAEDALDFLKEQAQKEEELPQLIILDLYMPGMDGFEFIEEFKKQPYFDPSITIVVVSTLFRKSDIHIFEELGIDNLFEKPIDLTKLISILKKEVTY